MNINPQSHPQSLLPDYKSLRSNTHPYKPTDQHHPQNMQPIPYDMPQKPEIEESIYLKQVHQNQQEINNILGIKSEKKVGISINV